MGKWPENSLAGPLAGMKMGLPGLLPQISNRETGTATTYVLSRVLLSNRS